MGKVWQIASRFTWELPQSLLGMALIDVLSVPGTSFKETYERNKGTSFFKTTALHAGDGVTLGNLSVVTKTTNQPHEWGHSIQSMILGPLFLPVVGIPSFFRATFNSLWPSNTYSKFYTEKWSDNISDKHYH